MTFFLLSWLVFGVIGAITVFIKERAMENFYCFCVWFPICFAITFCGYIGFISVMYMYIFDD